MLDIHAFRRLSSHMANFMTRDFHSRLACLLSCCSAFVPFNYRALRCYDLQSLNILPRVFDLSNLQNSMHNLVYQNINT